MTATGDRTSLDELCIDTIRTLSIDAVQKANQGHPGAPMGLAPVAYTLYTRLMRHNPANPTWIDRDRFILSAGHASMLLYSTLFLAGYPMTLDDIEHFRAARLADRGAPRVLGGARDRGDHGPARPGALDGRRRWRWPSGCSPLASTSTATTSSTIAPG